MVAAALFVDEAKKCVAEERSQSKRTQTASSMEKIKRLRMALINQAQTVMGRRGRVMPLARKSMAVTAKLRALSKAPTEKTETTASQSVRPVAGGQENAATIPATDAAVSQKPRRVSRGKAISVAPICVGRK